MQQPAAVEPAPAVAAATPEPAPVVASAPVAASEPVPASVRGASSAAVAASAPGAPVVSAKPESNRGAQLLGEAQALFKTGNYPAAKQAGD